MKKVLSEIYTNLLLVLGSITFLVTWPFILIGVVFHTLFKSKVKDARKLEIMREITIVFIGVGIFIIVSLISEQI